MELRVMWQILAAACCLHPAKALFQLRVATTLGAWRESKRGAVCERREKCGRSGQPMWKATCGLLGLHLLLELCYWTCSQCLKGSGVQFYKTPARIVWVAGSNEAYLSERSSMLITGKFSSCSLQSWFSYTYERLPTKWVFVNNIL